MAAVLLPSRALPFAFAGLLAALTAFFAEVDFFPASPLPGATRGFCGATLAFFSGFCSRLAAAPVDCSSVVDVAIAISPSAVITAVTTSITRMYLKSKTILLEIRDKRRVRGHGTKFSRRMEAAVAALLTQRNVEEAARSVGISVATLMRWQKQPEFESAYRQARRAAYRQCVARLQQGATAAATTLLKTMVDVGTPPSVRVRAAECVMNHAATAIEIEDLEFRLSELERAAKLSQPDDESGC